MTETPILLNRIHRLDERLFLLLHAQLRQRLITLARLSSKTADGWGYLLVPALLIGTDHPLARPIVVLLGSAFAVERLLYLIAKNTFRRRRPAQIVPGYSSHIIASDRFSLPSGHTSAAFLFATAALLVFGAAVAWLFLWAISVAASRVILGVHFPTDTLAGALLGSGTALAMSSWINVL